MRELRIQSGRKPIRIFYAFDPKRAAIMLIGGGKAGNKRFYSDAFLAVASFRLSLKGRFTRNSVPEGSIEQPSAMKPKLEPTWPPSVESEPQPDTAWKVEYPDEFGEWWGTLSEEQQGDVAAHIEELERDGPMPPASGAVGGSKHGTMRELRVQSGGEPIRISYAFDPKRAAITLIGGGKAGNKRFYW